MSSLDYYSVSIIVRTKNEERTLEKLLKKLREQTFKNFEIIIVDNESKDRTLEIARRYKVNKIISISDKDFSHSRSTNIGIREAKGELVILTNGHSVPVSSTWLEDGIKHFENPKVAAIDGENILGREATIWQKIGDRLYSLKYKLNPKNNPISTTNAIIRKSLWEKYPFDESLTECEDYDWSKEMIARGYETIKDSKFNVYHYHHLSLKEAIERSVRWSKLCSLIDKRKRPYKN